jgi:anthranilate synthase component 2
VKVTQADVLYRNCPEKFKAGRYHSWVLDEKSLPDELLVTAVSEDNCIMSVAHRTLDVRGVQFHPESILSEHGEQIIRNWIEATSAR